MGSSPAAVLSISLEPQEVDIARNLCDTYNPETRRRSVVQAGGNAVCGPNDIPGIGSDLIEKDIHDG
jgi:hypothetical protein